MFRGRSLVLISPLVIFSLFQFLFLKPLWWPFVLITSSLVCFFTLWIFANGKIRKKRFLSFFILPEIFILSLSAYASIVTSEIILQILFFLLLVFLYFYFKNGYYVLSGTDLSCLNYFKSASSSLGVLIFFFSSSALYGFQSLLKIPIWILLLIWMPMMAFLLFSIFSFNDIEKRTGFIYVLISILLLGESVWAVSFMPLTYNILGLVITVFYYIFADIVKFYLKSRLNARVLKTHLFLGLGGLILILLTAKWM